MQPNHTNRLSLETSPYLLQHQHNPVDWYPWGPEAFDLARRENRPIFLSVGYSTCYWCHVMERQSFENESVAAEMNQRFVNIKVDREERPDVDQLYMTAVQVLTRQGGWPMSVFLTPDLRPFYGGTYFPPTDMHGRPGFVTLLRAIEDAYLNRKSDVDSSADQLVGILQQLAEPKGASHPVLIDAEFVEALVARSASDFDAEHGGFGRAPKFPRQTLLELLLAYTDWDAADSKRRDRVMRMLTHTFDAMAAGGIRDQLGGGFHRYSTDAHWLVPHFEIMLYDNAMLGWCYAELHRQTKDPRYADVARGIFDFILRDMTSPDTGAFYTAFDAEVDSQEGLNYLWTRDEIDDLLGPDDAAIFNRVYAVDEGPNFADPHHGTGQPDKNILFLPQPLPVVAQRMNLTEKELEAKLQPMRAKLLAARGQRKQPLLDTKILTSWNALMIRALAYGGQILGDTRYTDAAARAAEFLLRDHRTPDGGLFRTSRDGQAKYSAFLDDYAFLVLALAQLWEATGNPEWRDRAADIESVMADRFGDRAKGGFFFTAQGAQDLIVRQKVGSDSPLPSGNAAAAMAMMALDDVHGASRVLRVFAAQLEQQGEGMSAMLQAALAYVRVNGPLEVKPTADSPDRMLTPEEIARGVVTLDAKWVTDLQLNLRLSILRGFHINAHQASEGLVPTQVTVQGADVEEVIYPPGEVQAFAFADHPIRVYANDVIVEVRLKQRPANAVTVRATYQACDDDSCLAPVTKEIKVAAS